jgi:hypothetical protein
MQKMQYEKACCDLKLLNGLHEITVNTTNALFIRHGDRNKIPEGEFGNDVELNEIGINRSTAYGEALKSQNVNKIYTSPIKRCVQTAHFIAKGMSRAIPIEHTSLLGDPGAFVYDGRIAGQNYLKMGSNHFYESLLEGIPIEGNYPIAKGAEIINSFFEQTSEKSGINIYVSHDMIIALYAFAAFGKRYSHTNWVKYLEGLIIQF